jgi:hypothetical protein
MRRYVLAVAATVSVMLGTAAVATGARTPDTLICGETQIPITVTNTTNENSVAWGVGTVGGGDHFIPTSFSGTVVDLTTGETLDSFSEIKGNGNGLHNQAQLDCSTATVTASAGELGIPGLDPDDIVDTSFFVTVVRRP